jgi:hypothetical protein
MEWRRTLFNTSGTGSNIKGSKCQEMLLMIYKDKND